MRIFALQKAATTTVRSALSRQLRGRYRSRPMEELLKEAQDLADSGVKELIVIAQDTSRYGIDLYGEPEAGGAAAEALRHRRLCLGACTLSLSGRNV